MPARFQLMKPSPTNLVISRVMVPYVKNIKTGFLYLGQPTTSGPYSLPRDSLIPGVVHGALFQRLEVIPCMVLTGSLNLRSVPYLRLDPPQVSAECIFMSWVAALCVQWTCPTTMKHAQVALLGRQNNLTCVILLS